MTASISVQGVSKRFKIFHERNQSLKAIVLHRGRREQFEEFWALRDVSFEVYQGESFALIGHNGSGKSTSLKCIAGILEPDKGRIEVRGKISALLELGAGFHPELSGRENIFLNGAILGVTQRELRRRFDGIVAFSGLEQFIDHPVKNYSSGMYARLGFSVMINVDPDVLLIDEVLAVGDEQFQRKCMEKIHELRSGGRTVMIVSHGLGLLRNMCDRAAWIDHGVVAKIGPVNDVVDAYLEATGQAMQSEGQSKAADPGRSGTGEFKIERIEILDKTGGPVGQVRTGDAAVLRLWWVAEPGLSGVRVAATIMRVDGIVVSGTSVTLGDIGVETIRGEGHFEYAIDKLALMAGSYIVGVTATDLSSAHIFDDRRQALRFEVTPGVDSQGEGLVTLGGRWR